MGFHLLHLPAELQLKIVQQLVPDEDKKNEGNRREQPDEPVRISHDLISWSCTCSYFRNLLAPEIFRTTILANDEKSGDSLNAVAKSPHNVQVKELHFVGTARVDAYSEGAAFWDADGILPCSVEALLCDLQKFPNLEKVSIRFEHVIESLEWAEGLDNANPVETERDTVEAERCEAGRALMCKTYSALAQNKSRHLKHLEVRQLIWKKISTLTNTAFRNFLAHLQQFTLSIHGKSNDVGQYVNITEEYPALMGLLDEYFFNHLTSVTTLTIKAPRTGPLGLNGWRHAPLRLHADQMPLLKILNLENIFASSELTDFLVGHKSTLEVVTLRHCYACPRGLAGNGIYWSELFTALVSACPVHLRHFTLNGSEIKSFSGTMTRGPGEQIHAILRENPARILFPYVYLGDIYGGVLHDNEESAAAFLDGDDQASWTQLMALLEENRRQRRT